MSFWAKRRILKVSCYQDSSERCSSEWQWETEHLESQEKKTLLLSAINLLKEEERDILTRRYYYEQKPKTIATALGLSVKRVENILYRAKQKLRQILADQKEVLLWTDFLLWRW